MPLQVVQSRGQLTLTSEIRKAAGIQPGDTVMTRVTGPGTIEIKVVPTLTLAELLQRYRIEGPIDEAADRDQWQAEAASEALGATDV
jgi:bifunctional DNA-binding transcriptional regulator/antitoxin component of YhaV-PrlF toxin-antitoxin module